MMTSVPTVSIVNAQNVGGDIGDQIAGYVFVCNTRTKPDCFTYRVFGLPASRIEVVEKIRPSTNLFLFDTELKLLYGLYVADSSGKLAIEPYAFGGRFPAQVKFSIVRDCLPLPEVAFKDAIKENYYSGSKFKQELSDEQVSKLVSLFRPISLPLPPQLSPVYESAMGGLHPAHRGSRLQIAKLPSHNQYTGGSGFTDTQQHPSLPHGQKVPLPLSYLSRNQVAMARSDKLDSQRFVSLPSYQQHGSASSHQAYHPDDTILQQHGTHVRNMYVHSKRSSTVVPHVTADNSYYDLNPMPHSNLSPGLSKAVRPLSTMLSSSLTASQWVAVASQAQTPGGQTPSFMLPSSGELNASYGSNSTDLAYQYHNHNQGYPSSYQEHSVIIDPVHARELHSASPSTYYQQSRGELGLPQTLSSSTGEIGVDQAYMFNGTSSSALTSQHQYQGYHSFHQTLPATTDQLVSHAPTHVSETRSTYWIAAPSGYSSEQYPTSQVTIPGGSAAPLAGYVPAYSSGANMTY